jgi:hypothetical protein
MGGSARCECCALPRPDSWSSALRALSIVSLQIRHFIPARHRQLHGCHPVVNPTRDGALAAWSTMSRLTVSSSSHLRLAKQQTPRRRNVLTRVWSCPTACRLARAAHGALWPPLSLFHHDSLAIPQAAVPGRRQMVPMVSSDRPLPPALADLVERRFHCQAVARLYLPARNIAMHCPTSVIFLGMCRPRQRRRPPRRPLAASRRSCGAGASPARQIL